MAQLDGYSLVCFGGQWFIGRRKESPETVVALEPAYEANVRWDADGSGSFGVIRECAPITGSVSLRSFAAARACCAVWLCEQMSGRERLAWASAIEMAEKVITVLRAAESGLITASKMPDEPPADNLFSR